MLGINLINKAKPTILPKYQTNQAVGFDLHACLDDCIVIWPNKSAVIPTNLAFHLIDGYEAQIRSRSGLAFNHHICIPNAPGTIDSDYTGEVKVLLYNYGTKNFRVNHGDRIAQVVLSHVYRATDIKTINLERGNNGFGSTGYIHFDPLDDTKCSSMRINIQDEV